MGRHKLHKNKPQGHIVVFRVSEVEYRTFKEAAKRLPVGRKSVSNLCHIGTMNLVRKLMIKESPTLGTEMRKANLVTTLRDDGSVGLDTSPLIQDSSGIGQQGDEDLEQEPGPDEIHE